MDIPEEIEVHHVSTILHYLKPKHPEKNQEFICLTSVMTETGLPLEKSKTLCEFMIEEGMLKQHYSHTKIIDKQYKLDPSYEHNWIIWI